MRIVKFTQVADATRQVDYDDELGPSSPSPVEVASHAPRAVYVNADAIRSFTARKGDLVGTRLVFTNGIGMPVQETVDEVVAAFNTH